MALPTKAEQIEAVVEFLDDDSDRSLSSIAKDIVNGMYDMWGAGIESAPLTLTQGLKFKTPWSGSIQRVSWLGECKWMRNGNVERCVWVTEAGSKYGVFVKESDPLWRIVTPSTSKAELKGNADGWEVGGIISHSQKLFKYKVVAVSEKAVLMSSLADELRLTVDTNEVLKRLYTRESNS